jgi:hypothetical protein
MLHMSSSLAFDLMVMAPFGPGSFMMAWAMWMTTMKLMRMVLPWMQL